MLDVKALPVGSTVQVTSVDVVGYNTRVSFEVLSAMSGSKGYVDFHNLTRGIMSEDVLLTFVPEAVPSRSR